MRADFSGYATKAGLLCSDGRTITSGAFKHQHQTRVPLVWQHGHSSPTNVLGHGILENRDDGVYVYAFFNNSEAAANAKEAVVHGDINSLSIWANNLVERAKNVIHGQIREVSLVLSGANPGAVIENVTLRHSDGDSETLDDVVVIHTGLAFEVDPELEATLSHAEGDDDGGGDDDETIQDVYDNMDQKEKDVLHYMVGVALENAAKSTVAQSAINTSDTNDNNTAIHGNNTEGNTMTRNVFEKTAEAGNAGPVLSHDDMKGIFEAAAKRGSLKDAVNDYLEANHLAHGITDIDTLFPDAKALDQTPEWDKRRTEWVADLIGSVRKSPFSRIKSLYADITMDDARAKGYVTGAYKKEEFFPVAKRVTTPTTIYKKQALDRDDIVDITDFDVVMWMKGEMRLMLDEELARAILFGDGRDIASEDKINEQNIRPIATDHELYVTTVNVNVDDASSSMLEVVDALIANRYKYKGTGVPTLFTTEYWISRFMQVRDGDNRRMWRSLEELATELRVSRIVPVEAMQEQQDIVGIIVNPVDYVVGADKGGAVAMFDDFDIDYNKYKYLIETRVSGALTKLKSALVLKAVAEDDELVVPATPTFDPETGALTITDTTGVVYKNGAGTVINNAGSPYTVAPGATYVVNATPASGYFFATSDDDSWSFTADA